NKDVTVVEFTGELAAQGNMLYKIALRQKMEKAQTLHVMLNTSCMEILDGSVEVSSVDGTSKSSLPCDTVIISTGVRANRAVAEEFYGIAPQTFMIGDCNTPAKIMEATFDGYNIAANL
ncbi:MAG TPA: 2,4-dienoyl-CoA reductase, partial [Treponema sp.]|nr:2,4-dienoyl-CoA reductase [Treponema sp.]